MGFRESRHRRITFSTNFPSDFEAFSLLPLYSQFFGMFHEVKNSQHLHLQPRGGGEIESNHSHRKTLPNWDTFKLCENHKDVKEHIHMHKNIYDFINNTG